MAEKSAADISLQPSLEGPADRLGEWKIPVWLDGSLMVLSDGIVALLAFVLGSNYKSLGALAGAAPSLDIWLGSPIASHLICYIPAVLVLMFTTWERGLYVRPQPFWDFLRESLRSSIVGALTEVLLLAYISRASIDKASVFHTWLFAALLIPLARVALKRALIGANLGLRPVAIIGCGRNAFSAARALEQEWILGLRVIGFCVRSPEERPSGARIPVGQRLIPVHALGADPAATFKALGCREVALALESPEEEERFIAALGKTERSLIIFSSSRALPVRGLDISQFFSRDVLMFRFRNNLGRRGMRAIKSAFDLAVAAVLLACFSWFFLLMALLIKTSGPVFFGHWRIGQGGARFLCYKFRTMVPDAESVLDNLLKRDPAAAAEWARDFKLKNDPRITPIGRFLRRTSLDELPQLWNVLVGQMSLVGPRPIVDEELVRYGDCASYYLQCKPGITGVWQVSGRNDTSYEERVSMDTWYVRNWSLWHDFVILLKTVSVVFRRNGAY